ncbi:uncharacterized protein C8Q71DRAFT_786839 [Rhodofomes roseus]|uniref:Uncharacterized protein n=1 Tax=Rhodofomes roseus TaxID=34475 RepID=A0ABQ8K127_9APHY|nr:uncharacterized protein C8Q71DRAFT_786839 [Rhodofomes roseus]KAH9830327.1 hypothetical protein C8Q71DRAFT_786839 [Rhodofomes roseus]
MDMQSPEHVQTECVPVFGVDLDEVNRTRPLYGESLAISLHRHRHRITQQLSTHFLFIIACAVHAAATSYIGWMFVRANKPSPEFEPDLDLVITDGVCGGSIVIAFFTTIIAELARGTERACERMRNRGVDTVELKWKMPRLWGTLRGAWQARADAQPLLCLKLPIETQNGYPVVPICRMVGFIMSSLYGPALGFQV